MTDRIHEDDTWPSPAGPSLDDRIAELEDRAPRRFSIEMPEGAIPNGPDAWWLPGPPPPADGSTPNGVDVSGWRKAGWVDETGGAAHDAPALGLDRPRYATGGIVEGAPGRDDDRIPAVLSPGCVLPAEAVKGYGADPVERLNAPLTGAEIADLQPGARVDLVLDDGTVHRQVVTEVGDGTITTADVDAHAAMERMLALDPGLAGLEADLEQLAEQDPAVAEASARYDDIARKIAARARELAGETFDPIVLGEDRPGHRAARQLTDGERSVLANERRKLRRREQTIAEERGQLDLGGVA